MKKETVISRLNTFGNELMKGKPSGREKRVIEAQVTECLKMLLNETWASLGEKVPEAMQAIVREAMPYSEQERAGVVPLTTEQEQAYQSLVMRYSVYKKFRELIDTSVRTATSTKRSREHYATFTAEHQSLYK